MMTTNLFVIANVKRLRTGGSFRILRPFLRTSWGVGILNSAIFNSFHNQVEFCMILEGLQNFGRWGWPPPPSTPLHLIGFIIRMAFGLEIVRKCVSILSLTTSEWVTWISLDHWVFCMTLQYGKTYWTVQDMSTINWTYVSDYSLTALHLSKLSTGMDFYTMQLVFDTCHQVE